MLQTITGMTAFVVLRGQISLIIRCNCVSLYLTPQTMQVSPTSMSARLMLCLTISGSSQMWR